MEKRETAMSDQAKDERALDQDEVAEADAARAEGGVEGDYEALVKGGAVFPSRNPDGGFTLVRIGDAVASRNIHAAIYDGIRYALRM